MDWLRIGAFALLILYHVGMVFVPWGYHVKTAHPIEWVQVPMLMTNAWRLTLLFLVSGYASRGLLARSSGIAAFVRSRNGRLLLPLAFGIVVIAPPNTWVELVTQHGYAHGYFWFVVHDYFRFGKLAGIVVPTWDHLWFVAYLWVYTLVLALLLVLPHPDKVQTAFDRTFAGWRSLLVPLAWLLLFQVLLFRRGEETHDLLGDGVAHLAYFPAFLFGFGLGSSRKVLMSFARLWIPATLVGVAGCAVVAAVKVGWLDGAAPPYWVVETFRVAREVQTWGTIAGLIGIAERFLNRDYRYRVLLVEAVFPFYIIHQSVIVLGEFWLLRLHLPAAAEFATLVGGTVTGCFLFYLLGREIAPLRPLIGLRAKPHARAMREPLMV
jgi:hypothetical protein